MPGGKVRVVFTKRFSHDVLARAGDRRRSNVRERFQRSKLRRPGSDSMRAAHVGLDEHGILLFEERCVGACVNDQIDVF